jgi:hypothetical protein
VIDEAAKVRNLEKCWNEAIRPTLADMQGGRRLLLDPQGPRLLLAGVHVWGKDPLQPDWRSWTMPTAENPFIDPAEIEAARLELPERVFRRSSSAEFLDDAGGVFRNVAEAIDPGRSANEPPIEGAAYSMGCDLARVEDFTVLAGLDAAGRQVYHERFNQISWERQIEAIARASAAYNRAPVHLDSTGLGDPIFERLRKAGVPVRPYQFTNASKGSPDRQPRDEDRAGTVRLMDVPAQTNELRAYQYELTPSRNVRMNAPEGMHDDCVIALALARGAWRTAANCRCSRYDRQPALRGIQRHAAGRPGCDRREIRRALRRALARNRGLRRAVLPEPRRRPRDPRPAGRDAGGRRLMARFAALDIDAQESAGVFTCFASANVPAWPLAGWTWVVRTRGVALGVFA